MTEDEKITNEENAVETSGNSFVAVENAVSETVNTVSVTEE